MSNEQCFMACIFLNIHLLICELILILIGCLTTGYCFLFSDSLISWRSKKQTVVSHSSTEAEYRALADTVSELLWLHWLLQDIGVLHSSATPLHCDNCSAMQIVHNDIFHEHTKHIENDFHFIRHYILKGTIHLISVSFTDQIADIFTKAYSSSRFHDLVFKLQLADLLPS